MPISVAFSTTQVVGLPQNIVLVDTSSGTDVTATSRRVYIQNAAGAYIVPSGNANSSYIEWLLASGNTLTLNVLTQDSALNITLVYVNGSGGTVATTTNLEGFTLYNETFYYSLTQAQASQSNPPPIIQDTNYYANKMQLRVLLDSGNQAISLGGDIVSAQSCYDMATLLVNNQNDYF